MNTWGEAMKAIGALEDRVKKLEGYCFGTQQASGEPSIKPGEIVSMPGEFRFFPLPPRRTRYLDANGAIVDRTAPSITETGRILVDPDEYARLERLNAAAREFIGWLRPGETTWLDRESSILKPLREALER